MKKVIALILSVVIILSFGTVVSAEEINTKIGDLSVVIPEGLTLKEESYRELVYTDEESRRGIGYIYLENMEEGINSIEQIKKEDLDVFLNMISSEEVIKEGLMDYNEAVSDIKITETDSKYIKINGISVYEHTLWYTSSIQNGSVVIGLFVNEGDLYMYLYERTQRDTEGERLLRESVEKMRFDGESPGIVSPIKILIDGDYVYPDSDPTIVNDRTLVPIRAVAEKLGYEVSWVAETRTAVIASGETVLKVTIDSPEMIKETKNNQEKIKLDVAATIINDRTYLPLRAIGEALGCNVDWDGANRTVIIES